MAVQWSGLGPELLLRLDRASSEPLRSQLERELREAIRSHRLAAGERLPSSRELARGLGVSRGLVQDCYEQLLAEGYLSARAGSGTRVAAGSAQGVVSPIAATASGARPRIDFRPGVPDLSSFPRQDWMWAMREVIRTAPAESFGYGDPRGSLRLREVLAGYIRRVRGADAAPERIVICNGFAQGFSIVLRVLAVQQVRVMGFEDPGHVDNLKAAEHYGLRAVPMPLDEHGIHVDALAASGARSVLLTPAHQSPSGVVLAPARRQALAEWAASNDAIVIEDDYDSEFRYDREPVGVLQGLAPHHTVLIGTVSKSLSPALRLGWIVCPRTLLEAVVEEKRHDDFGSPMLEQLALATLIESGRFDRHLRRMRGIYAKRREALITALEHHAPQVALQGLAAGIHAVALLPEYLDEQDITKQARERSIGLYPMSRYRSDSSTRPPKIVLGFGNLTEPAITRGIHLIADLLR
jgi:GntR family transcriptional regulator / MocR family aminotransferase